MAAESLIMIGLSLIAVLASFIGWSLMLTGYHLSIGIVYRLGAVISSTMTAVLTSIALVFFSVIVCRLFNRSAMSIIQWASAPIGLFAGITMFLRLKK